MQKFFFFRKFIASSVFMLERYIKRPFFFSEDLELFSYRSEKTGKSSHKCDILTTDLNLDLGIGRTGTSNGRERVNQGPPWALHN